MKNIFQPLFIAFVAIAALSLTGCRKEGCTDENASNFNPDAKKDDGSCLYEGSTVALKFDHRWGNTFGPFSMNEDLTHPGTQNHINFTTLNYYISNVKLKNADGTWWTENESYHLVKVTENTVPQIVLEGVPLGKYTEISYMIGVDSTRNVSGAQTGALSPSHGMFWSWTTGYIFIKAEGHSNDAPMDFFTYHIGGFSKEVGGDAIRINNQTFNGEELNVRKGGGASIHFHINVARLWHGGIQINETPSVHMPGQMAETMATNFSEGFIIDHLH